jgi:hypothetical protein
MTGRAHWSGTLSQWSTDNGKIHQNALYGSAAAIQFGDSNWTDFDVTFDYETGGSRCQDGGWVEDSPEPAGLVEGCTSNYLDIMLDASNHRIMVAPIVSGSNAGGEGVRQSARHGGRDVGNVTFLTSGKLRLQVKANKTEAVARRPRRWSPAEGPYSAPYDVWDVTGLIGSGNRQGKVGVQQATYRWPVLNAIAVPCAGRPVHQHRRRRRPQGLWRRRRERRHGHL